ncbi:hypothetical protein [Deinococcus yavapaiensis]|uniref:META domain-containing protein n=1 Tax=Deinococcus yavapaiensis KR-236 TaxID=694435 RepID=A0A318SFC4_9DEIO|nr:hypothetical protein [Deinococcus yavapaiensis]PYE55412.1 hypothetical protein DES52_103245 [Deinococcus yavapaiensis KR-236]
MTTSTSIRNLRALALPTAIVLASCGASSASVPAGLVGAWFSGASLPDEAYDEPSKATASSARFVFGKDGTYEYRGLKLSHEPGYFGTLLIACESLDVTTEQGTFTVQGDKITLKPKTIRSITGLSPAALNSGCKRSSGVTRTRAPNAADVTNDVWHVSGTKLTFGSGGDVSVWARRAASASAPTSTPSGALPGELRGEWNNGRISPIEYYNTATGKWAEASGTSVILKMNANMTYERTGLLVVTTYGCTSKLLVHEQGKIAQNGATLTFTPTTSSSTGYTCTPSKIYTKTDAVKPYSARAIVRVEADGRHVLTLADTDGDTVFNRPLGTAPESAPSANRGAVTPPAPASSGAAQPSVAAPTRPAATPTPTKWTAAGDWDATLTLGGQTYRARVTFDEEGTRLLGAIGYKTSRIEALVGDSGTGGFQINFTDGDDTVELVAQGRFDGDRYAGSVRGKFADVGAGTLTLTRR